MSEHQVERRKGELGNRVKRISATTVGGGAGFVIADFIIAFWGGDWNSKQVGSVYAITTWTFTAASVCFWDVRALFWTVIDRVFKRRKSRQG